MPRPGPQLEVRQSAANTSPSECLCLFLFSREALLPPARRKKNFLFQLVVVAQTWRERAPRGSASSGGYTTQRNDVTQEHVRFLCDLTAPLRGFEDGGAPGCARLRECGCDARIKNCVFTIRLCIKPCESPRFASGEVKCLFGFSEAPVLRRFPHLALGIPWVRKTTNSDQFWVLPYIFLPFRRRKKSRKEERKRETGGRITWPQFVPTIGAKVATFPSSEKNKKARTCM